MKNNKLVLIVFVFLLAHIIISTCASYYYNQQLLELKARLSLEQSLSVKTSQFNRNLILKLKNDVDFNYALSSNLKDYIMSEMAKQEKANIGIDGKLYLPDGTFCKVDESLAEENGSQIIKMSKPYNCEKVVIQSITTNRLLQQKTKED